MAACVLSMYLFAIAKPVDDFVGLIVNSLFGALIYVGVLYLAAKDVDRKDVLGLMHRLRLRFS